MRFIIAFLLLGFGFGTASAQHGDPSARPARAYSTTPIPSADVDGWRSDLRQLAAALERKHPEPFKNTSRDVFASAVASLNQRIPALAAHEIIIELEKIIALIGDGHTNLNLANSTNVDFHVLPIRLGLYDDGVYVEGADAAYRSLVGGKVTRIGALPIDTVLARLRPIISRENDEWIITVVPNLINLTEVLHAIRAIDNLASAEFVVEQGGKAVTATVRRLEEVRPREPGNYPFLPRYTTTWVDASDGATDAVPLYRRRFDDTYWWEYLPATRTVYMKWDQVINRPGKTAAETFEEGFDFIRRNPDKVDKLIFDLRNNTGGEGDLVSQVTRSIIQTREIPEDRLFVVIGNRTFSAAVLMTGLLERLARPTFVGTPTGGKPVVAAGHTFEYLPHSGLRVSISPLVYQSAGVPSDVRRSYPPRLYARPSFADYAANRDPVMGVIASYRRDPVAGMVDTLIVRADTVGARRILEAQAANPVYRYLPVSGQVNALGYRYLRAGRKDLAGLTFRLNVRVHPRYANGWDSLGEYYMGEGMTAPAIAAFEEVLRLDPANERAQTMLRQLRGR